MRSVGFGFAVVVATAFVPSAAATPEEIFSRGNSAYEREDYEAAIDHYETVIRYGVRDWRVEYNLGNAYFKTDRLGEAILHYERAKRLHPTDPELRANLALARSRCRDRVEPAETIPPVRWIIGLQERLGPDRQAIAGLILLWGLAALVARASSRAGGWTPATGWATAAVVLALVLVSTSWAVSHRRLHGVREAVILAEVVEVRAGPGETNAALFTVHEGLTVEVRSRRPEWVQVSLPNGLSGWVPRGQVGLV